MVDQFHADDEFNFDSDLDFDFDNVGPDFSQIKDDRKPVTKLTDAAVQATRDYIQDRNNIVTFMRSAMPENYGQAFDMIREGNTEVQSIYNSVKDTVKSTVEDAKGLVRTALPVARGIIPDSILDRIEKLVQSDEEKEYKHYSGQDSEDVKLEALMGEIFTTQKDLDDQREERGNYRNQLQQGVEQVRHNDILSLLDNIRRNVDAQTKYQDKINYNYQKKSLELQYRHFWASAEILKNQKESNATILELLAAVQKNTALPDYAKLHHKEAFFENSRNKFMDEVRDSLFGGTSNFIRETGQNIRKQAESFLNNVQLGFSLGSSFLSPMLQNISSAESMGLSKEEELVQNVAPFVLDELGVKLGNKARKWLSKNKARKWLSKNKAVDRLGQGITRVTSEIPERVEELLTSPKYNAKMLEPARMIAASMLPNIGTADTRLEFSAMKNLNKPTQLTGQDTKTLREIIPGLLARIHREIRIFRTGDTKTPLIGYDFSQNRFSNDAIISTNLRSRFGDAKAINNSMNEIVDTLDPGKKLNEKQRQEFIKELLNKTYGGGGSLTFERLARESAWGNSENAKLFADVFKRRGRIDDEGKMAMNRKTNERQHRFIRDLKNTVSSAGDPRIYVQELVNMGQYDMLLRSGMVSPNGEINVENVRKHLAGYDVTGVGDLDEVNSTGVSNQVPPRPVSERKNVKRQEPNPPTAAPNAVPSAPASPVTPASTATPAQENRTPIQPEIPITTPRTATTQEAAPERTAGEAPQVNLNLEALEKLLQRSIADMGKAISERIPTENNAIDLTTIHSSFDRTNETLERIEQILLNTDNTAATHYQFVSGVEDDTPRERVYSSIFEHLKDKTKGKVKSIYQGTKAGAKYVAGKVSNTFNRLKPNTQSLKKWAGEKLGYIRNKTTEILNKDVFVGKELKPRLIAAILKNGGYFDAVTGKVLTSLKDIKGDVKDALGNVVLRAEELRDAYIGGEWFKKLTDIIGTAWEYALAGGGFLRNFIPNSVTAAINRGKRIFTAIRNFSPPYDVYVKGQKDPVLYASLFKMGKYFSKKTKKPLKHPRDLDGEVIDDNGNIVLSLEQIKEGLVDVNGANIQSAISRIWAKTAGKAFGIFKTVRDIGADAFKWVGSKIKNSAAFIKNMISGKIDIGIYSRRTSDLLEEIRDFMKARWGKKKVIGDADGDGIRDNSLEDMKRKREKDTTDAAKEKAPEAKKGFGILDKLTGAFASLKSFFDKKKDKDDDDDDSGFGLSDVADLAEIADAAGDANERRKNRKGEEEGKKTEKSKRSKTKKPKTPKPSKGAKPGRLRKVWNAGKWAAGKAWDLGAWGLNKAFGVGKTAAGVAASEGVAGQVIRKGAFSTALPALLARLGLGVAGTGLAATGAGLTGGAALAGGIGTVLGVLFSWPAVAATTVGYLAYKGYQNSKKTKLTPLSTVRLAQYGFTVEDKEAMEKVFELENLLQPHVVYDGQGWASVDRNKVEPKVLVKLFDLNNVQRATRFLLWYDSRFYPVYTRALSGMKHLKVENPILSQVETQLEPNVKEKYMDDLVSSCAEYHNKMKGPLPYGQLKVGDNEVKQIAEEQRLKLRKSEKNETGQTKATEIAEQASPIKKGLFTETVEKISKDPSQYVIKDKEGNTLIDLSQEELVKALRNGATISVKIDVPQQVLLSDPSRLDALTCIRYKTYGLSSMMLDKVQQIMALEALCAKHVIHGDKGATFKATTKEILAKAASFFGKPNTGGRAAQEWMSWFNERFLPIFLPFSFAVFKLTRRTGLIEGISILTPSQQLKIANMITGQSTLEGQRVAKSVWDIRTSPWVDYELNTNADTVLGNLETIRVLVSKIELKEPLQDPQKGDQNGNDVKQKVEEDLSKPAIVFNTGKRSKTSKLNMGPDSRAAQGMKATGDVVLGSGQTLPRMGEAAQISEGNGKKWSDLPNPEGSGWNAMKDLVIQSAQATGVDPKALAAYIAVESEFDPNAVSHDGKAIGLGQFRPSTWSDMMKNYSASLGVPAGTPASDKRANALYTGMYLKQNLKEMKKVLKRDISVAEGYLGHFAGATGASDLLAAPPDAIAAQVRPSAAKNNPPVFYDMKTKKPYTVKEMVANLAAKLESKPASFGVKVSDFSQITPTTQTASAPSAPASASASPVSMTEARSPFMQASYNLTNAPTAQKVIDQASDNRLAPAGFGNVQQAQAVNRRDQQETTLRPSVNVDTTVRANTQSSGMPIKKGAPLALTLQREPSTDDGTFGVLKLPDGSSFLTLELPWKNNQMRVSCIPPGVYQCAKRQTTRHGFSYEVKNVPGRSGILIHAGGTAGSESLGKKADSQGCILLGLGRNTRKSGQKGITDSKAAMQAFHERMQDQPFTLTILNGMGDEATVEKNPSTAQAIDKINAAAPQSPAAVNAPAAAKEVASPSVTPTAAVPSTVAASTAKGEAMPQAGIRGALNAIRDTAIPNQGIAPTAVQKTAMAPPTPFVSPQQESIPKSAAALSRGFKPTTEEMQVRNTNLSETLTKNSQVTNEILSKNLQANERTADNMEKLVKMLERANGELPSGKKSNTPTPTPNAPQEQRVSPKLTSSKIAAVDTTTAIPMNKNY